MSYLGTVGLSTGAAVGSGTISQDSLEGKITLDTTKLSSALASNFNGVKALFTNATGSYASEGLSQRMDDLVNPQAGANGVLSGRITSGGLADPAVLAADRRHRAAGDAARGGAAHAVHEHGDGGRPAAVHELRARRHDVSTKTG